MRSFHDKNSNKKKSFKIGVGSEVIMAPISHLQCGESPFFYVNPEYMGMALGVCHSSWSYVLAGDLSCTQLIIDALSPQIIGHRSSFQ